MAERETMVELFRDGCAAWLDADVLAGALDERGWSRSASSHSIEVGRSLPD